MTRLGSVFVFLLAGFYLAACSESDDAGAGKTRDFLSNDVGMGAAAPDGAVILGEGRWQNERDKSRLGWQWNDGVLTIVPGAGNLRTVEKFGDCRLHVEFNVEATAGADWKGDGNSGVYIQRRYELQILNSFGKASGDETCGALYTERAPDSNASRPAGEWQVFDIVFRAARWEDGKRVQKARVSVSHNDTLIHDDVPIPGSTGAGKPEGESEEPLRLQDHGSVVQFRNIWIERLDLD